MFNQKIAFLLSISTAFILPSSTRAFAPHTRYRSSVFQFQKVEVVRRQNRHHNDNIEKSSPSFSNLVVALTNSNNNISITDDITNDQQVVQEKNVDKDTPTLSELKEIVSTNGSTPTPETSKRSAEGTEEEGETTAAAEEMIGTIEKIGDRKKDQDSDIVKDTNGGDGEGTSAKIIGEDSSATTSTTEDDLLSKTVANNFLQQQQVNSSSFVDSSPPLTFKKYLTMQDKRVPVTIRYSQVSGLRPYFLTIANKIKQANPDVVVEKMILPSDREDGSLPPPEETVFEVLVDNRIVIGKARSKWQSVSRNGKDQGSSNVDLMNGMSVFISMEEVNLSIAKARRKRRPSTAYIRDEAEEGGTPSIRLEMLKGNNNNNNGKRSEWND